jgi:hypothetical protein
MRIVGSHSITMITLVTALTMPIDPPVRNKKELPEKCEQIARKKYMPLIGILNLP